MDYIRSLSHLKTNRSSKKELIFLIQNFLSYAKFMLGICVVVFIYFYILTHGLLDFIVSLSDTGISLVLSLTYILIVSLAFVLAQYINRYYKMIEFIVFEILSKRKKSCFPIGFSHSKKVFFFTKNALGLKDYRIFYLAFISISKDFSLVIFIMGGLSARFDNGFSSAIYFLIVLLTSFYVSLPETQKIIKSLYGPTIFRLVGWNVGEVQGSNAGRAFVLVLAGGIVAGETSNIIYDQGSEARYDKRVVLYNKECHHIRQYACDDPKGAQAGLYDISEPPRIEKPRSYYYSYRAQLDGRFEIKPIPPSSEPSTAEKLARDKANEHSWEKNKHRYKKK